MAFLQFTLYFCSIPVSNTSAHITEETENGSVSRLYEPIPDFTPCFRNTLLVWVPCAYIFFVSPFYFYFLLSLKRRGTTTWLNITKTVLSCLLVILCIADLVHRIRANIAGTSPWPANLLAGFLQIVAMLLSVAFIQLGRLRGVRSTGVLFIYWLLQLCSAVLLLQSHARLVSEQVTGSTVYELTYISVFTTLVLIQLVLASLVDYFADEQEMDPHACPEGTASFLSLVTFWWFTRLVVLGYQRPLTRADLWNLNTEDTSREVYPPFEKEWMKEVHKYHRSQEMAATKQQKLELQDGELPLQILKTKKATSADGDKHNAADNIGDKQKEAMDNNVEKTFQLDIDDKKEEAGGDEMSPLKGTADRHEATQGRAAVVGTATDKTTVAVKTKVYNPSLWMAIIRTYYKPFCVGAVFKLGHDILMFASPLLLKFLIRFIHERSQSPWRGYIYTFLMFAVAFAQSMFLHQYFHRSMIVGMRIRAALVAAIYKKSLLLSNAARKKSTLGEIVNLMSVDAQRFMELTAYLNMIWSAPFQMCVCLYFLWMILGPSVLAGVGVMVLMIPINAFIAKKSRSYQVIQMKLKDQRIKLMNEVLNGIKVLKLYAWEPSFQKKILEIRSKELKVLRKSAYLNAAASFTWSCAPFMVSITTFAVYVMSSPDNVLDAEKAFVSLSLFNILRFPLSMLPMLIANLVQTSVSVKRLRDFLKNEELDDTNVERDPNIDAAITVSNGVFAWDKSDEKPTLSNVNIEIKEGSFVSVVGQVGCGKSSLLSAILGETEKLEGTVSVKGSVSYVSQQAWIQNATLHDNVLFSKPLNEDKYNSTIDACALRPDLDILPGKDMTEIGEKGINLSGGQKQRVSLARAVYANTDVYLLDDPLSAVDAHVGKHIFDQVLGKNGLLKNKTRVLVTHGISFLPQVDQIIVMVDGQISEVGTYKELLERKGAFAHFLYTYLETENIEELNEIDDDEMLLRSEILSQIGTMADSNMKGSVDKLHKLHLERMDSTRSDKAANGIEQTSPSIADRLRSASVGSKNRSTSALATSTGNDAGSNKQISLKGRSVSRDGSLPQKSESEKVPLTKKDAAKDNKKLIQDEAVEKGSVKLGVFLAYMHSIGPIVSVIIIFLYILNNAASVYANFWLSDWSNDPPSNDTSQRDMRLGVYGALGFAQGLAVFLSAFALAEGALRSSTILHETILRSGLRAPMQFFDSTPIGRVINRFSKDIEVIDSQLPRTLNSWFACCLAVISTLFVVCYSTPMFLIVVVPMGIVYYLVQRFYVATSRQLRRLESVSRSPIFSHFGETVQGATTIRAYRQQDRFILESEHRVDENQLCYYPGIASNRWLAVRLEFVGNCLVMFAALFAVIGRDHLSPGIVGLSISYALNITQTLNWLVRMTSELETNIVAVERVKEYAETPSEAEWVIDNCRPADTWPDTGAVDFNDYSTRYRPELEPVLRDITLHVNGGEKIGIVGRTGAGKSSLTLALFRIIEAAGGKIVIDGVNISDIGLHDLRSKLTIIPQEPVLFSGTLRLNLDPFEKYSDEDVWRALENAHLKTFVTALPLGLQHECTEGGDNLSVGQRQLVCLARALLRKTKVLILDEATAAVDLETDDLIQSTIRTEFAECTVLTIAHRINTIMDYNRILVLDRGQMAEYDAPATLLANKKSIFYQLAADAGLVPE